MVRLDVERCLDTCGGADDGVHDVGANAAPVRTIIHPRVYGRGECLPFARTSFRRRARLGANHKELPQFREQSNYSGDSPKDNSQPAVDETAKAGFSPVLRRATGQTSTIPVGMLFVDLYDAGKKQLIWRGDANKTIDLKKDPDENYKNLQKAVAKLFKNYPPQSK